MTERPVLYDGSAIQYSDIGGVDPRVAKQLGNRHLLAENATVLSLANALPPVQSNPHCCEIDRPAVLALQH
jgi:hypothetical protein